MKSVAFYTLGCKVNTYETEAMASLFAQKDYEIVSFEDKADIYIINTCTVTAVGDKKSRQMIRRAKRRNPDSIVAVTGCYAQVSKEEVEKIEGVNLVVGTANRSKIVELVEQAAGKKINIVDNLTSEYEDFGIGSYHSRTRATVKIQDGCDSFCSYCIIPYARGRVRSRSIESIIKEVSSLAEQGFLEVVLVGIHLASYGKDLNGEGLMDVIEKINQINGIKRIRLGSLEPNSITDEFVRRALLVDKLCPHFHLSLQSGCDATLKRMNRKYTMEEYFQSLERIRKIPDCGVTTDIMVGFPGETDQEFQQSLENIVACKFASAHIFPYSKRQGTPAAKMADQIPEAVKAERAEKMQHAINLQKKQFLENYVGREMWVLFEQDGEGLTSNYLRVKADGGEGFQTVRMLYAKEDMLIGELCEKNR